MGDSIKEKELATLIRLAHKVLWADPEIRRRIQARKVNIVPANFYSDIPLVDEIHASFEYREADRAVYDAGLFDREALQQFLEQLYGYADEFDPPLEGDRENPAGFFWKNPAFSYCDAMAYYCMIRHFKPDHIVEIGSGFSTLVADHALKKNGSGKLTLIEPYPMAFLKTLESVETVIESFVQDIPVDTLVRLIESCGIWFIDSTHTVKIGSDCLYLYLRVMPAVKKDIIVHTHDVYLPFGPPKNRALEKHIYWTEQYLLYAYMLDNPKIEMLFGSYYAHQVLRPAAARLMANKYPSGGASIWYKLRGASAG